MIFWFHFSNCYSQKCFPFYHYTIQSYFGDPLFELSIHPLHLCSKIDPDISCLIFHYTQYKICFEILHKWCALCADFYDFYFYCFYCTFLLRQLILTHVIQHLSRFKFYMLALFLFFLPCFQSLFVSFFFALCFGFIFAQLDPTFIADILCCITLST